MANNENRAMTTPENIKELAPNEVFVFGSNHAGRHGAGAAWTAYRKFGALWGQGTGLMGSSYGIATKSKKLSVLPLSDIHQQVLVFLRHAQQHPEKRYLVTSIGCGLAGYKPEEIAPFFLGAPSNVVLPSRFQTILENIQR